MRGKGNNQQQQQQEEEESDMGSKKEGLLSNPNSTSKDGKSGDKVNAMRSKHSVTEQKRRSKINERFQILRELIPHGDQKRDTASFLLEVIEYVQFLQEKVQKYEGSYQGWSPETTKLIPWRNSHWRAQTFVGHPQAIKNGSGQGSTFPGKYDENNIANPLNVLATPQSAVEPDANRSATGKEMEQQPELANRGVPLSMPFQAITNVPVQDDDVSAHSLLRPVSEAQSTECPITVDSLNQQEELTIEGGTISISSVYSQGLLNNLTQALQTAGIDLSQANISVRIDIGKRANRGQISGTSTCKDSPNVLPNNQATLHLRDMTNGEESDQVQKRQKT